MFSTSTAHQTTFYLCRQTFTRNRLLPYRKQVYQFVNCFKRSKISPACMEVITKEQRKKFLMWNQPWADCSLWFPQKGRDCLRSLDTFIETHIVRCESQTCLKFCHEQILLQRTKQLSDGASHCQLCRNVTVLCNNAKTYPFILEKVILHSPLI